MPFVQLKLDRQFNQSRGIFDKYAYAPDNGDTISDILMPGYFIESRFVRDPDWVGSLIEVIADDGRRVLRVTSAGTVVDAGLDSETADIVIRTVDDFPNVTPTTVPLDDQTTYRIKGDVDIGNRVFDMPANSTIAIYGISPFIDKISNTSTQDMFAGDQIDLTVRGVGLTTPGEYFNFTKTAGFSFIVLDNIIFNSADKFGQFSDLNFLSITAAFVTTLSSNGLIFSGTGNDRFFIEDVSVNDFSGTLLDFGSATFRTVRIDNNDFNTTPGDTLVQALPNSGNIRPGGAGEIIGNRDFDDNGAINGITPTDIRWDLLGNSNSPDSYQSAVLTFSSSSPPTTNISDGVYQDIAGVATFDTTKSGRSQAVGDNGFEMLNETPVLGAVTCTLSASKTGGSAAYNLALFIDKNTGTFVQEGEPIRFELSTVFVSIAASVTLPVPAFLAKNWKYKFRIAGDGTTDNISVTSLNVNAG